MNRISALMKGLFLSGKDSNKNQELGFHQILNLPVL